MALLRLVRHRYLRANLDHIGQYQQRTGGKFRLTTETESRGIWLQHPQWNLQRLAIGVLHGRCAGGPAWPRNNVETAVMKRMKRIMNRHRRRHGIQCGCC
jgi:hypothetical protein